MRMLRVREITITFEPLVTLILQILVRTEVWNTEELTVYRKKKSKLIFTRDNKKQYRPM